MRDRRQLQLPLSDDVESGRVTTESCRKFLTVERAADEIDSPTVRLSPSTPLAPRTPDRRFGAYLSRFGAKRGKRRAVLKNGYCNVTATRVPHQQIRFLQDIFTTLVDAQWRWTLLVFACGFVGSWVLFAVLYWLIAYAHGDLDVFHLPPYQEDTGWTPCISNIFSMTSCFLFSLETQHTIGYGTRATTEECPEAIFVMTLQSIHGVMIQAFMAGIVFAKMTRSKRRTQTLLFSRHAVVSMRNGELCLMFRVGDIRKSHIIGANIRAQLIKTRMSREGEVMAQYQSELEVGVDSCSSELFFIWPQIVVHRIDEKSPLYHLSAQDMLRERFEIVAVLEGTIESTGQSTQARSSFINSEVLWGHRFEPILFYSKDAESYEIDFSQFNRTRQTDTPLCSAKQLRECVERQQQQQTENGLSVDGMPGFVVEHEQLSKSMTLAPLWVERTVARSVSSTDL